MPRMPESLYPFVCLGCGTQYAVAEAPPHRCPLCEAERRLATATRPAWTTLAGIARRHQNIVQRPEQDLFSIHTLPTFAAGQRALLVRSAGGNLLWDSVTLLDQPTIATVRRLGGLRAIAVSHPRYYSSMVEWSHAFGRCPIYVHASGWRWLMRPDPVVRFWHGERLRLHDGITLVHRGGYDGGTTLHWPAGAGGTGVLLTSDVVQVVPGEDRVSFLANSAGMVPRSAQTVERIVQAIESLSFGRLYDASPDRVIADHAREIVLSSAEDYIAAVVPDGQRVQTSNYGSYRACGAG
jgi:hypothetical protein